MRAISLADVGLLTRPLTPKTTLLERDKTNEWPNYTGLTSTLQHTQQQTWGPTNGSMIGSETILQFGFGLNSLPKASS